MVELSLDQGLDIELGLRDSVKISDKDRDRRCIRDEER